ncbi:hypothetical protein PHSC3_000086 [Chlamydiales bacterium STE3]|nr:hypothetical protein PHSC3_000086 [Chlamydiales bacterium STE3]
MSIIKNDNPFSASFDPQRKKLSLILPTQKGHAKHIDLSARLYNKNKEGVFTVRPFRAFFAKHIKIKTEVDGKEQDILIRMSDLQKELKLRGNVIENILKDTQGNLESLMAIPDSDDAVKKILTGNLNLGHRYATVDNGRLFFLSRKGKIKAYQPGSKQLGKGGFKAVHVFTKVHSGDFIKRAAYAEVKNLDGDALKDLEKEYQIGQTLYSEFKRSNPTTEVPFVKYYSFTNQIKKKQKPGFLMGYCETDLRHSKALSPKQKLTIFHDVLQGVAFMNAQGYVHRDLKPANILLKTDSSPEQNPRAKIVDFDLSSRSDDLEAFKSFVGTKSYAAPEAFQKDGISDPVKLDSWSLGIILYELHFQQKPFEGKPRKSDIQQLLKELKTPTHKKILSKLRGKESYSPEFLISKLLTSNPAKRWSPQKALDYMNKYSSLLA